MFSKKKLDIDKYVEECLRKINNETERNLRCLSFAKQYFKIERYEDARRYVCTYLRVNPNSAEAHCLLGRCLEMLDKKEGALQAFKTSLRLDPKQNNLVLKVCELFASDDIEIDYSGAKYFCEMGQNLDPHNPAIFNLKQKIVTSQNDDPDDVSNFILKELEMRPTDVKLRIRLLKHLLQHNMIKEAYKHASDIEAKDLGVFHDNIYWYQTLAEVLVKYQQNVPLPHSLGWEYWFLSVSVLDSLVSIFLKENGENIKITSEYVNAVFNFDQTLCKAAANINTCPDKNIVREFLNHYRAQLCLHLTTLAFKQAQKDILKYKEVSNFTLPLLFHAYHSPPPDLQGVWFNQTSEVYKNFIRKWRNEASYRCSQAGHILIGNSYDKKSVNAEKAAQFSVGLWRENLFKKLFINRDHQLKMKTSFFLTDQNLIQVTLRPPDSKELLIFDEEAQLLFPDSLHNHIWIALTNKLSDFRCTVFSGLQYSVKNLKNCGAETLNVLDIQAFIYCCTLCAKFNLEHTRNIVFYDMDKPNVLPASVTHELGTINQNIFFKAAYKMYKNEYDSSLDQVRLTLVDGIKTLRCIDNALDVKLLVILAQTFSECASNALKQSEIEMNEARAEQYWKVALPILEKIKNDQAISYPPNKLFNYKSKELNQSETYSYIEMGKLFIGKQLMKKNDYEKALRMFEILKDPYATFHQAQIYKSMADQQTSFLNKENVTSEMRSQNITLLSRARDCLYLTLDRLREPSTDRKHPLNAVLGTEIEKIERLLSRIDPDCTNRNECDGMSDENLSSAESDGDHYITGYSTQNNTYFGNVHSTPYRSVLKKREARPSPERLDAQLRQLSASKDVAINHILEHNKVMMDSHKCLTEELKSFKEAVNNLTTSVEELKDMRRNCEEISDIKKTVDNLKSSIDEFENLKNIPDMVYEMKKEIQDLKKEINKTGQLSEEDLYGLTNDYGADFNINSNLGAYNANLYQNYPTRIPGAASLYGPPPIYSLYPGMAYAYGGLGLPHGNSLQFGADQQLPGIPNQDFRSLSTALPQTTSTSSYGQPISHITSGPQTNLLTGQGLAQIPSPLNLFRDPKHAAVVTSQALLSNASVTPLNANTATPPVNVVITSSDPLPLSKFNSQTTLSVTIPVQHLKGNNIQPHSYQIPLPITTVSTTSPSVLTKPPPTVSTESLLSHVARPIYSAISDSNSLNVGLGLQVEKSLELTFNSTKNDSVLNKSNTSTSSFDEHDPCPDFKPIIDLPDEVPLNTGEENETVFFTGRAKLFRYAVTNDIKEWKERGTGIVKILKNFDSGKVRLLMRRDQIHKICANHFLTKEMVLSPMNNSDCTYIWAAHDYADGELVLEKFCIKFKSAEEAKLFFEAFENARKAISVDVDSNQSSIKQSTPTQITTTQASLGGFVFTNPPTFKFRDDSNTTLVTPKAEIAKISPFSGFTFNSNIQLNDQSSSARTSFGLEQKKLGIADKISTSSCDDSQTDDFVPTAEFKPVISLPELVEFKTGEENSEILFESKATLLRFDNSGETKEWKEKGTGIMKILKNDTVRLLMRRDQVLKVCCNHQLLSQMEFKFMNNNPKALTWCAKDFSEGVITPETLAIKFGTSEIASNFLKMIKNAQNTLDENNYVKAQSFDKHLKTETKTKSSPLTDKAKSNKSNWECKVCYVINEGKLNYCVACDSGQKNTVSKSSDNSSGAAFSFGVGNNDPWNNALKLNEGKWECKHCYTRNKNDKNMCIACQALRDNPNNKTSETSKIEVKNTDKAGGATFSLKVGGVDPWANALKLNEGKWECKSCYTRNESSTNQCISCSAFRTNTTKISNEVVDSKISSTSIPKKTTFNSGFGDKFKPEEGSWECSQCFIRNAVKDVYCVACQYSKDGKSTKQEATTSLNLDTPGHTFKFGLPTSTLPTNTTAKATFTFGQSSLQFPTKVPENNTTFVFKSDVETTLSAKPSNEKFVFGSPQKYDFEFIPKSPRRISSGAKDEESDCNYVEEEEEEEGDNIYFKPVIPLPDKVEVKTGEEEEEILYCQRAKLFRFVAGEWKERGLGDIKILKKRDTGRLRVLMRREQIFKICLNHGLTTAIKYTPKDEKTWLFCAADFSEEQLVNEKFCVRFKTAEIANEFIQAVNRALSLPSSGETIKDEAAVSDDEIIFISETVVTPEEEEEALRLGLPKKFLSYRQLPDCSCEQCRKDDIYLKELLFEPEKLKMINYTTESEKFSIPKKDEFTKPQMSTTSTSVLKDILKKPSLVLSVPNTENSPSLSTFSKKDFSIFSASTTSSNISSPTTNIFSSTPTTNLFGSSGVPTSTTAPRFSFGSTTSNVFTAPANSSPLNLKPFTNTFGSKGSFSGTTPIFGTTSSDIFKPKVDDSTFSHSSVGGSTNTLSDTNVQTTPSMLKSSESSVFAINRVTNDEKESVFSSFVKPPIMSHLNSSIFSKSRLGEADKFSTTNIFASKVVTSPSENVTPQLNDPNMKLESNKTLIDGKTSNLKEDDKPLLDSKTGISFAALAAKSGTGQSTFDIEKTASNIKPFAFLGAGAPVFSSTDKNKSVDDSQENIGSEDYDPHYDPIIPLPDTIVVSTGEEDEEILFNERSKLFRFDAKNKEWKERGVGQMKILYHSSNNTYRFVLRREQVYKVVLNQLIVTELELQPMTTSDKAWVWAGYNYTDDGCTLEKLAIRFKNCETAQTFYKIVYHIIDKLRLIETSKGDKQEFIPSTVQNIEIGNIQGNDESNDREELYEYDEEDDEDEENDDDEDDDDDGRTVMFDKSCTLSEEESGQWKLVGPGDLQVYYDPDLYAARICITSASGEIISNTIIGTNTEMQLDNNSCVWKAYEWSFNEPILRHLKVSFSNATDATEFHCNYLEGMTYAHEFGIMDELPRHDIEE